MLKYFYSLVFLVTAQSWFTAFDANAQVFSPNQIPNLVLWLRADSLVDKSSNNIVDGWINCVNLGIEFSGSGSNRPTWVDSAINGRPVIRFNGNDFLSAGNVLNLGTNSRTTFVVAKKTNNNNPFAFWSKGVVPSNLNSLYYYPNELYYDYRDDANRLQSIPFLSVDYNIISTLTNRSASLNSLFINSNLTGSPTPINSSYSVDNTLPFLLGAYNDGTQFRLIGDIPEFIVYDSALADSNRLKVEQYLCLKYGNRLNLGEDITQTPGSICSISLNAPAGFTNYEWSTTETLTSISVSQPGEYWLSATNNLGCETRDTIKVSFLNIPDTVLCPNSVVIIYPEPAGPFTYLWSTNSTSPTLAVNQTGTYSVTITDPSGSCSQTDSFTVTSDPFPSMIDLGIDDSLCSGNIIGLQSGAQLAVTYLWNPGGYNTSTIAVGSTGYYSVTVTSLSGCSATDSMFVTIIGTAPNAYFSAPDVCLGTVTSFTDLTTPQIINSWLWDFGGGNTDTIANPFFTFSTPDTYNVKLTVISNAGCENSIIKQVKVVENPIADFELLFDACVNNPFIFNNNSVAGNQDSIISYNWAFGDGAMSVLPTPSHSYSATGTDTVELTIVTKVGCSSTYSDILTVVSVGPPAGIFSLNQPYNNFIGVAGNINFAWSASVNAATYALQISTDNSFSMLLYDTIVTGLSEILSLTSGNYYWRVLAKNICGQDTNSEIRQLSIINLSDFNGFALWLRADSLVSKSIGNIVNSWTNCVSPGIVFSETGNNRPTWVDSALNKKPVIRFNGNNFLSAGDVLNVGTNSRTAFVVARKTDNNTPSAFWSKGVVPDNLYSLYYYPNELYYDYRDDNTHIISDTFESVGYNIITAFTSRSAFYNSLFVNSNSIGFPTSINTNVMYPLVSNLPFLLGAYNDGSEFHLTGDIAELIIYDEALPDSARYQLEQYLRFKYAPQINLGPDIDIKYGVCDTLLKAGTEFTDIIWSTGDTTPTIRVNMNGTYWVTAKDIFGYTTSDTVVVNIAYKGPNMGDTIICTGSSVQIIQQIAPVNAYTFLWQDGSISNSITASAERHYSCIITDTVGCTLYSDTVFVNVDSFELLSVLPVDTTLCNGNDFGVLPYEYAYASYSWKSAAAISSSLPTVAVDSSGSYSVIVTDVNQCVAKDTIAVTRSWYAPAINFTAGNVCFGDSVRFNNLTDSVPPDKINLWSWTFGDDSTSSNQSPAHLYTTTGDFPVKLYLKTDSGCTGIKLDTISVYAQPKAIYISAPQIICAGIPVSFIDTSELTLPDTLTRLWIFNNADSFTSKYPAYTFPTQGNIPLTFIVTSNHGCADTISTVFEIFPSLIADFSFDSVCFGSTTGFIDITASNSIVSWQWNFGDNSFFSNAQSPTHRYSTAKTYNVRLTVTNAIGCVSAVSDSVKIAAIPVAAFANQNAACEGYVYAPHDNSTSLNDSIVRWDWNIGNTPYPDTRSPQHLFATAGNYPVTLLVTTESGCQNSVTRSVTINPNPTALFGFTPLYGEAPLNITFNNMSVNGATYLWSFGDNDTSTDKDPVHTYLQNDTFDIVLNVYSDSGCTDSFTQSLAVISTELDLSVDAVDAKQTPLTGGYVSVKITVTMSNRGTRIITTAKLYAILGSGGVITEECDSLIYPGQTINYVFTAQFVTTAENANTYICVDARSVNNGETETRPDNNRACTSLSGTIQLVGPSPNPVSDRSVLGIILPKTGKVDIAIVDAIGKYILNETAISLPAGRSDFEIPVHQMSAAEYFIRVIYNEDKFVRKFVVKR